MNNSILLLCILFIFSNSSKAQEQNTIVTDNFQSSYTLDNGKIGGPYKSFYDNGQKKAEGQFENNYRTGKWIVWDSTGIKKIEDYVFDSERMLTECRIIGICPVVEIDGVPNDLFWIYFPQAREYFAKETLNSSELPTHIKSLDDLFFFRNYSGKIYKERKLYDEEVLSTNDAQKIEIDLIENEHELWLNSVDQN